MGVTKLPLLHQALFMGATQAKHWVCDRHCTDLRLILWLLAVWGRRQVLPAVLGAAHPQAEGDNGVS